MLTSDVVIITGSSVIDKIERVRARMSKIKAGAVVISALDSVNWLMNIRGRQVQCVPVHTAYALVTTNSAFLFADNVPPDVTLALQQQHVTVMPYHHIKAGIQSVIELDHSLIMLDPSTTVYGLAMMVPPDRLLKKSDPVYDMKCVKNDVELTGIRDCCVRDSAAIVTTLYLLDTHDHVQHHMTEIDASDMVTQQRGRDSKFLMPSFDTIAASGINATTIHYRPTPEEHSVISHNRLFLLDSGGQYKDGTTDVTRTVYVRGGDVAPTPEMIHMYTLVLQGHIDLACTVFPCVSGNRLDCIARRPLWSEGYDYGHGTGHGVGHSLMVHEGPIGMSTRSGRSVDLYPGNVLTNGM